MHIAKIQHILVGALTYAVLLVISLFVAAVFWSCIAPDQFYHMYYDAPLVTFVPPFNRDWTGANLPGLHDYFIWSAWIVYALWAVFAVAATAFVILANHARSFANSNGLAGDLLNPFPKPPRIRKGLLVPKIVRCIRSRKTPVGPLDGDNQYLARIKGKCRRGGGFWRLVRREWFKSARDGRRKNISDIKSCYSLETVDSLRVCSTACNFQDMANPQVNSIQ